MTITMRDCRPDPRGDPDAARQKWLERDDVIAVNAKGRALLMRLRDPGSEIRNEHDVPIGGIEP